MKSKRLTSSFTLAIGLTLLGVLGAAPVGATRIADRPLNPAASVKPNVIFGVDNSGSMDFEVMLYGNDGAFWWHINDGAGWGVDPAHPNPALRTLTSTWFNASGTVTWDWRKIFYLFPNGTGAGERRYGDEAGGNWAAMPTSQLAFLRWSGVYKDAGGVYRAAPSSPAASPLHNPLYYNPMVTYSPWAPAQLNLGPFTGTPAAPAAALSHPLWGVDTMDLSASAGRPRSQAADRGFVAAYGMVIPAGAEVQVCDMMLANCGPWQAPLAADMVAPAGGLRKVAMDYFPATYWVKEDCNLPATPSVGTDNCTIAPDGSRLKRYEIRTGNTFPSGRSYADELQNFANWFQYHRKRKLMLAGAMGQTLSELTGMRLAAVPFNNRAPGGVTMYEADSPTAGSNRLRVAGQIYEMVSSGGTPTRETLVYIGEQFNRTDATAGVYNVVTHACQRNNAFILTDGFADASNPPFPAWTYGAASAAWWGLDLGPPYTNIFDGSLADLALRLYTNNPRPDLPYNRVHTNALDGNQDLHINTYALTLGARGTLYFGEGTTPPTVATDWPNPNQYRHPSAVDDLWHATIVGRGKMYLATTPEETAARVRTGLRHIASQEGSQAAMAVSNINLGQGTDFAYLSSYDSRNWSGDLRRQILEITTGVANGDSGWSAATVLAARAWTTRFIFSNLGNTGQELTAATFGAAANPAPVSFSNTQVIEYLRGNRSNEGSGLRTRGSLIGATINSEPLVSRGDRVVYLAAGSGMLHAFDTDTGEELWAYQPADGLANAGQSIQPGWNFSTLLDATPVMERLSTGSRILVGGMGVSGRSYYALDVSQPRPANAATAAAQFKWTFPSASDTTNRALMGYTVGKPVITRTAADGAVVLVTSGYNNEQAIGDGKGRLWLLNANTGAVIKTYETPNGSVADEAGLAQLAAFKERDGNSLFAYAGDLQGNLWRFDLSRSGAGPHAAELVAVFKDSAGDRQPVTTSPELVQVGAKRVILVGTGRLLHASDMGNMATQSFYAVADGSSLSNARNNLVARSYSRGTDAITGTTMDWANERGWYMDLAAGEHVTADPLLNLGTISFVSNKSSMAECSQSSYLYQLSVETADRPLANDVISTVVSDNSISARVVQVRAIDGRLTSTVRRNNGTMFQHRQTTGAAIPGSKDAWREIRR